MAINRNSYKSLLESINESVSPTKEVKEVEEVAVDEWDEIDEILAEGIEMYGEEGLAEILAAFAETGEISEELAEILAG